MKQIKVCVLYNDSSKEYYEEILYKKNDNTFNEFYFEFEKYDPVVEYGKIVDSLKNLGYDAYQLNIADNLDIFFEDLIKNKPDVIFNFVETIGDNSRLEFCFVGILEILNLCYTGARPRSLANCQNKILAKKILLAANLPTPDFVEIRDIKEVDKLQNFEFPAIAKPVYQDASVGISASSLLYDFNTANEYIKNTLNEFKQPILVEKYIDGRELNVALLNIFGNIKVFPISEIDFSALPDNTPKIVSFEAKWDPYSPIYHKTIPICPAKLETSLKKKIITDSKKIFELFECQDYARIDLRLDKNGNYYFIDINPNPNLEEGTGFLRNAQKGRFSPPQVYDILIKNALQRKRT